MVNDFFYREAIAVFTEQVARPKCLRRLRMSAVNQKI
jgi:hypothetical protein